MHLGFTTSTKDAPIIKWTLYNQCILGKFSTVPPEYTNNMTDYIDNVAKSMIQIGITNKRLQITLFITSLEDPL
jgi:hypothetical protein